MWRVAGDTVEVGGGLFVGVERVAGRESTVEPRGATW